MTGRAPLYCMQCDSCSDRRGMNEVCVCVACLKRLERRVRGWPRVTRPAPKLSQNNRTNCATRWPRAGTDCHSSHVSARIVEVRAQLGNAILPRTSKRRRSSARSTGPARSPSSPGVPILRDPCRYTICRASRCRTAPHSRPVARADALSQVLSHTNGGRSQSV